MSLVLALVMVATAQDAPVTAAVRALPKEVAGLSQHWDHQTSKDQPFVAFMGSDALDPVIVVALAPIGQPGDFKTARLLARGQPNSVGLRRTLFEARLAVASKTAANTFFGEYFTDKGLMQVWLVEDRGVRTLISTTILRIEDRRRMFDAVRRQLLGDAKIIKDDQPAAGKD